MLLVKGNEELFIQKGYGPVVSPKSEWK